MKFSTYLSALCLAELRIGTRGPFAFDDEDPVALKCERISVKLRAKLLAMYEAERKVASDLRAAAERCADFTRKDNRIAYVLGRWSADKK